MDNGVQAALDSLGFRRAPPEAPGFLSASRNRHAFLIAPQTVIPFRRRDLHGALADATLRLQRAIRGKHSQPLVAIHVEKATPAIVAEVEQYLRAYAPRLHWLVADNAGARHWRIHGNVGQQSGKPPEAAARASARQHDLFAPRFQWLWKVLLLGGAPNELWGGPRERPASVTELARVASVSQPRVSVFVAAAESEGYLRRAEGRFAFPDVRRLLDDWAQAQRQRLGRRQPVKLHYPPGRKDWVPGFVAKLRETKLDRMVVGSYLACHLRGVGRSNVKTPRLYVARDDAARAMAQLDVVAAPAAEAAFEIVEPRAAESVFRGAVRQKRILIADPVQCYLDVLPAPPRGAEQAQHLFDRLLAPWFRSRGWL